MSHTTVPAVPALLIGHRLDIVSDTLIGSYCFHADGHVAATLGMKDGPVAAPVFRYRVLSGDSIEIVHSAESIERWSGIRIEGGLLHVERNGRPTTFTLRKPAR